MFEPAACIDRIISSNVQILDNNGEKNSHGLGFLKLGPPSKAHPSSIHPIVKYNIN